MPPGRFRSWTRKPPLAGSLPRLNGENDELQVAGAGVVVRLVGDADIRRQVVARAELVGDDAAHAGEGEGRAGPVAGEHVVRAALVGGLAVRHRADDGDLVGDLGGLGEALAELTRRRSWWGSSPSRRGTRSGRAAWDRTSPGGPSRRAGRCGCTSRPWAWPRRPGRPPGGGSTGRGSDRAPRRRRRAGSCGG